VPTWWVTAAAAAVGLGGHFANVLPDLAGDRATGVAGLPQRVAARWGPGAVRAIALILLLSASLLLVLASSPGRRWIALVGLGTAALLAVFGARGSGRLPFLAAIGIAAVDVAVLAVGGETLT
jgi:4-hydroxybenzoate polyprenyltransferase